MCVTEFCLWVAMAVRGACTNWVLGEKKKNSSECRWDLEGFFSLFFSCLGQSVCTVPCLLSAVFVEGKALCSSGKEGPGAGAWEAGRGYCARNQWSRSDYFKWIASFSWICLSQRCGVAVLASNLVCLVPAALSCSGLLQLSHCWGLRKEKGRQRKEVSCGLCLCCAVSPALLWGLRPSWMFPFVMWSTSPFQNKQAFPPLGKGMWLLLESRAGKCSLTQPLHPLKLIIFLFKQWSSPLSLLYITTFSVSIFFSLQHYLPQYFCEAGCFINALLATILENVLKEERLEGW